MKVIRGLDSLITISNQVIYLNLTTKIDYPINQCEFLPCLFIFTYNLFSYTCGVRVRHVLTLVISCFSQEQALEDYPKLFFRALGICASAVDLPMELMDATVMFLLLNK